MGRITEKKVAVAIVTMVTVYVGGETNIYWCKYVWKRSQLSVNGTCVKEIYRVKSAIAHRGRGLISSIALLSLRFGA